MTRHALDCSVNVPAWPLLPCDCGAEEHEREELSDEKAGEKDAHEGPDAQAHA